MKFTYTTLLLFLGLGNFTFAQTFTNNTLLHIPDAGGYNNMAQQQLFVSGLPTIANASFGLMDIQLNIQHPYDADLTILLRSPSGSEITLSANYGGSGSDFSNTHFNTLSTSHIYFNGAPFTGNFQPNQWMGIFNNGQNPNGLWTLKVADCCAQDSGNIINWSLTFGNQPVQDLGDSSSLPIVEVYTYNAYIVDEPKILAQMKIVDHPTGMNHFNDAPNYQGPIGIEYRGSTSQSFPQKPFALQTWDLTGNNVDTSILGFPSQHDWILYAPFDDKSMLRNVLTYKISNAMGHYASRTKFVELYINGNYEGVYVFMEKITRDKNRVNIKSMDSSSVSFNNVTGGYIFKIDKTTGLQNAGWYGQPMVCDTPTATTEQMYYQYDYPSDVNIMPQQQTYLQNQVTKFENSLINYSVYDTVNGYRKYISTNTFIDHSMLVELARNIDGYRLSSYYHKNRDDKDPLIKAGPVWDYNLAYGNGDYLQATDCNIWQWSLVCPGNPVWWRMLFEQDSVYRQDYKCRYTNYRKNVLKWTTLNHWIDSFTQQLQIPQQKNFVRWPILGVYTWPNAYYPPTFQQEIDTLKHWLQHRLAWMDTLLLDTTCQQKLPNGIKNITALTNNFSIVPNPAGQQFSILLNLTANHAVLKLYNIRGELIKQQNITAADKQILYDAATMQLPTGVYFITITADNYQATKQLVIE